MATYYRVIAGAMRALLLLFTMMSVLIPVSWWRNGEPFPSQWWLFYLIAVPVCAILWFASSAILQMASRSK